MSFRMRVLESEHEDISSWFMITFRSCSSQSSDHRGKVLHLRAAVHRNGGEPVRSWLDCFSRRLLTPQLRQGREGCVHEGERATHFLVQVVRCPFSWTGVWRTDQYPQSSASPLPRAGMAPSCCIHISISMTAQLFVMMRPCISVRHRTALFFRFFGDTLVPASVSFAAWQVLRMLRTYI